MLGAETLPDRLRRQTLVRLGRDHRALRFALSGPAARGRANFAPNPVGRMAAFESAGESVPPLSSVAAGARAGREKSWLHLVPPSRWAQGLVLNPAARL